MLVRRRDGRAPPLSGSWPESGHRVRWSDNPDAEPQHPGDTHQVSDRQSHIGKLRAGLLRSASSK
jgi:hypothetical protein